MNKLSIDIRLITGLVIYRTSIDVFYFSKQSYLLVYVYSSHAAFNELCHVSFENR